MTIPSKLDWRRALALLAMLALAALPTLAPASDDEEDSDFTQARSLFWSGQYDQAEPLFKAYLVTHPDHAPTRSFLQMITQSRSRNPARINETRKRLEGIIVPHLSFKESEWREVSAWLQEQANPKKDGKEPDNSINFINLLPSSLTLRLSLDLRKVTLLSAIQHACEQVGLRYVIDSNAVIFDLPEQRKK